MKKPNEAVIRLDFDVVDHNDCDGLPTPEALADAVQSEVDQWEDYDYQIVSIRYANFDDVPTDVKQKRDAKQLARIAEQDKLIAHLERKNDNLNDRNRALVKKNKNQRSDLSMYQRANASQYTDIGFYKDKAAELRQGNKALHQINDEQALVIEANREEIAGLENRLTEALIGWEEIQADRTRLRTKVAELVATDLNHKAENVGAVRMVAKIVDAMQAEGFDIAGWGNDDQLIELEDQTANIYGEITEMKALLDNIRTERG